MVLSAPGGTCRIPGGKRDILQVSTFRAEDHDTIRVEHGNPQVPVSADAY